MSRLSAVSGLVQRTAVRKGIYGGSRAWLAVAVGTWSFRQARRVMGRRQETVLRETLRPGETLVISHTSTTHGASE